MPFLEPQGTHAHGIGEHQFRDYAELMAMLHPPVDDDWDRQMMADAAAGRLDRLVEEARADIAAGRSRPLEELLSEAGGESTQP